MIQETEHYKSLDFFAKQVVEGFITGLHRSPFHGFSVEFAEHRLYNTGESTRNIDWKLYARTDKLFVKRFEEETNLRCQVMIDQSSSMLFPIEGQGNHEHPNKLTFAALAAAVLVEVLLRQRDAFGLTLFSHGIDLQTEVRSSAAHQHYLYHLIENLLLPTDPEKTPRRSTAIADNIHIMAEKMHRRSLFVIFTDALVNRQEWEPLFDSLRHLRHCKHEVILFHTLHQPHEVNLDFGNKPCYFIDMETDRRIKVFPNEIAQRYGDEMRQRVEEVQRRAIQYNIDYIPVDVTQGFDQILQPYLLKRSRHR